MSKRKRQQRPPRYVNSLFDQIVKGNEYSSIAGLTPNPNVNLLDDIEKGIREIETIRKRPCVSYLGNILSSRTESAIDASDDMIFRETINNIDDESNEIDIVLSTNGGNAGQVAKFVDTLRERFKSVTFLIPSTCMSAGTLWALSGNEIYMTTTARFGPIDPQVTTKDGAYVPAQSIWRLLHYIAGEGQNCIDNGHEIRWELLAILDGIDKTAMGYSLSQTEYSITLATEFLTKYNSHIDGDDERAVSIAADLADHEIWLSHSHLIDSKTLNEIGLEVKTPDEQLDFALTKLWAVCIWIFDKTNIVKIIESKSSKYCKFVADIQSEYGGQS